MKENSKTIAMKKILTFALLWVILLSGYGKSDIDSIYCSPWFYYNIVDTTADGNFTIVHFYTYCDSFADVTHMWDFGDSTYSNEENPVHNFSNSHPVYQVCHQVSADYMAEYYCDEVNIVQSPLYCYADFRIEENTMVNCNCPGVYNFYDQSVGDIKSWSWDFGDGNVSAEKNPTHMYNKGGIFDVSLSIETNNGCRSYVRQFLVVGQPDCDIKISWDVLESYPPQYHFYSDVYDPRLVYSFIPQGADSSWNDLIVYRWDFGDGETSDSPFPTHVYDTSGEFTVCLNVTYSNGTECEACTTDYFEGGEIDKCIYTGTFYKSNNMCDHDFIITDWGNVLAIKTMLPEIALSNGTRIEFGYEYAYDTLWNCYEQAESVIITCIEEIGNDTIWPPPYCDEQIILSTSYAINDGGCGGYASIDFASYCSAWIYYHMYDYSILWSTGETTQSVYGLCPNNLYLVSVTRSDGMTYNAAFSFFQLNNIIPAWNYYSNSNTYYFNLPVTDDYTVEWKFDDETSVFGTDISYIFTQSGTHTVDLNVWNSSGDKIYTKTIIISVLTSIKEDVSGMLKVYPLPAGDILNLEFESAGSFETAVRIYNVAGQFIYEKDEGIVSGTNHLSLDISGLKPGMYLMTIETPQGILRQKINK
jgi:PKD repeat protein